MDSAGRAPGRRLIFLLIFLCLPGPALSQSILSTADSISDVKRLYDAGRWSEVVQAVPQSPDQAAELQFYRGLALGHLQRWDEAKRAFQAGLARNPRDTRFLNELAGIAYRQARLTEAARHLQRALAINSQDQYANEFLASIYFLQGNLEAALKYWNRAGKPKLTDLAFDPQPRLHPILLDRAFSFSPASMWRRDQFLTTQAQLKGLDLFPQMLFDLEARPDGSFDLKFRAKEMHGWGDTKWEGLLSLLRGLPYESIYPEFYNLGGGGLNWRSMLRWDDQKRRIFTEIAGPLAEDPALRYRFYFEGRNENWDVSNTFAPALSSLARLNLQKAAAGAEIQWIASGRLQWNAGVEYSYREFRDLLGIPEQAAPFFTNGSAIALRSRVQRSLVRLPESRFTLDSSATGELGTFFENPLHQYGRIEGSLAAKWFPEARGEDYETDAELRAGRTIGTVTFDELFMLGFDRDNDLWLRGHPGLLNGARGNAPLGRNFILANLEAQKILYKGPFFVIRAGSFLDTGDIYDPSRYFGSSRWLWDTGIEARIRVLGSVELVLGYGKDLRSGRNSFFTTSGLTGAIR